MDSPTLVARLITHIAWLFLSVAVLAAETAAKEPPGRQLAEELKVNVVRIEAIKGGFGFIVAERSDEAYIVTANHVVRSNTGESEPIVIYFHQDPDDPVPAVLLPEFDDERDVAVIRASFPTGRRWRRAAEGRPVNIEPGITQLWYIGRWRAWETPRRPGQVIRLEEDDIRLEMRVPEGSSGAPLIADDGIVGILVEEARDERSRALRLDTVKDLLLVWSYPWDLEPDPKLEPTVLEAARYYDLQIYDEAFTRFKKAASQGNPHAMSRLGWMYMVGEGTPENFSDALDWLTKAANAQDADAMVGLGHMYSMGLGVEKNPRHAAHWLRRAAESGSILGTFFLAAAYERGHGVERDLAEAIRLYLDACRRGYKLAETKLRDLGAGPCR